jgi:hypothetical protein
VQRAVVSSGVRIFFGAVAGAKDRERERETCCAKRWLAPVEVGWQELVGGPRLDRCPGRGRRRHPACGAHREIGMKSQRQQRDDGKTTNYCPPVIGPPAH